MGNSAVRRRNGGDFSHSDLKSPSSRFRAALRAAFLLNPANKSSPGAGFLSYFAQRE
jgi:hypothetical protein